jgi:uncharacterized damage-inducible protein DinB
MSPDLNFQDLIDYTEWERGKWFEWLRRRGDQVLQLSAGAHGDGRFETLGDLIRHIFSAEMRYIDRLSNRDLTDPASVPNDSIEALFQFGEQSRRNLKQYVTNLAANDWYVPAEYKILNSVITGTPKKIVTHVLLHEIRHWAQIATLFRLNGMTGEFHDFLFSPVMGGEIKRGIGTK